MSESLKFKRLSTVPCRILSTASFDTLKAVFAQPKPSSRLNVPGITAFQSLTGNRSMKMKQYDTKPKIVAAKSCKNAAHQKTSLSGNLNAGPGFAASKRVTLPIL